MEDTLHLKIYTLGMDHYIGAVKLVTVPTIKGMVGFLPHHTNYISETVEGSVIILGDKDFEFVRPINTGYVTFEDNTCKIWSF